MTEQQCEESIIRANDLFLELREDFIEHIGSTAIEVKRK